MAKITTYLELGRVSNLPTVLSNVVVGAALAGTAISLLDIRAYGILFFAVCAYVGGMALNDYFDVNYDKQANPARPIPSGRISQSGVLIFAAAMAGTGLFFYLLGNVSDSSFATKLVAPFLLFFGIVLYNSHHKGVSYAPWVMGACRALLYACAAAYFFAFSPGMFWEVFWGPALCIVFYVAGLTYLAKYEGIKLGSGNNPSNDQLTKVRKGQSIAAGLLISCIGILVFLGAEIVLVAILLTWIIVNIVLVRSRRFGIGTGVQNLIAGICLLDLCVVSLFLPVDIYLFVLLAGCFLLTLMLQKKIKGT